MFTAQVAQSREAERVLQRIERDGQRVQSLGLQGSRHRIEHRRVARLQVRAVENQRHHRRTVAPARAQVVDASHRAARAESHAGHMQCDLRQAARRLRRVAVAQAMESDGAQELQRIGRAARTRVLPQLPSDRRWQRAAREQVFVLLQVAREDGELLPLAARELLDLLQAIRPGRLGAQVVDDHDPRVLQHLVDVQVERSRLAQVLQVGEPQRRVARVARGERGAGRGEQRQRGVGRAQHHDVARRLVEPGDDAVVFDEASGLGAQQVHGGPARRLRPSRRARLAAPRAAPLRRGLRR